MLGSGRVPASGGRPSQATRPILGKGDRASPIPRSLTEEIRAAARPGQADRALQTFEKAVGLLERGRDAAAAHAAEEAKDLAPRSGAVREVLGIALYRAERFREALRELQAYRRMTGRLDHNHLIADSYRALGSPEKAIESARAALGASRIPEEARAESVVVGASALADLGRFDEAIGMLRAFPTGERVARPFDLRVWYVTGDVLERAGRRKEAAAEFRKVIRHDPGAFDSAERLARLQ
jgi:tetratricopeptide (TPR) repeat protein